MNIFLKIQEEELGRFLLAYNRGIFGPLKLGASFLFFYGLNGYKVLALERNDDKALGIIKEEFLGRLN
jgi:hypothetical protein